MSDKHEKKTPKEYFLTKVYATMQEFEDTTGKVVAFTEDICILRDIIGTERDASTPLWP